jgi:hypothetical protein
VGRPAQRTQGSVPENQFRRPRPDLHGERLTKILEPLLRPWETSTAPARGEEHCAAGSPNTRPRWTTIRANRAPHRRTGKATERKQTKPHERRVHLHLLPISKMNTKIPRIEGIDPTVIGTERRKSNRELLFSVERARGRPARGELAHLKEPTSRTLSRGGQATSQALARKSERSVECRRQPQRLLEPPSLALWHALVRALRPLLFASWSCWAARPSDLVAAQLAGHFLFF